MTTIYKSIIIVVFAIVLSNCQNSIRPSKEEIKTENSWVSLFNGVNLDNWNVKIKGHPLGVNWNNTFIVVDSAIRVNYKSYTNFDNSFGHIFYKSPYSNYKLNKVNYIAFDILNNSNKCLKDGKYFKEDRLILE